LFSNAIKYKAQTQPSIVTILFTEGENEYRLIFEDNGLGFDSEKYADKLFQPFQRFNTHTEGKGLGLYLVKSQVDALGATISLTSKSGVGTKVDIVFPKE
jgi:signal transduction histidine kinase